MALKTKIIKEGMSVRVAKHCIKCDGGSWQWGKLEEGKPPHMYGVRCVKCNHHSWMSKFDATVYNIIGDAIMAEKSANAERYEKLKAQGIFL